MTVLNEKCYIGKTISKTVHISEEDQLFCKKKEKRKQHLQVNYYMQTLIYMTFPLHYAATNLFCMFIIVDAVFLYGIIVCWCNSDSFLLEIINLLTHSHLFCFQFIILTARWRQMLAAQRTLSMVLRDICSGSTLHKQNVLLYFHICNTKHSPDR